MNKEDIEKVLEDIGLAPAEAAVYMALLDGAQSAQEIVKFSGEKRPTVYYSLNSLEKRGLVSKTGKEYGNKFQVEPLARLEELVQKNILKQTELLDKTQVFKEYFSKKIPTKKSLVSYFDSAETVKVAIFNSLYCKEKLIRTIVPADNFFHEMGKSFVAEYVKEKTKRKIKTVALWENIPNRKFVDEYYTQLDVRQLPVDMHNSFDTTIFIYDDKTLYVSPKSEQYAVLIQSVAHTKMMRALFDNVWGNAFEVKNKK
jgi:sugar-specific transcriptional regulator TrmB